MAKSKGNWISGAVKKPGALRKELGVSADKKIPVSKIDKAAHSKNPVLKKKAILAKTFAKMRGK